MKNGLEYSDKSAVTILILYDIGYFLGSFMTGYLSDLCATRQKIMNIGTMTSIVLAIFNQWFIEYGTIQFILFPLLGLTVGGTLILLTTSCSTELVTFQIFI